MTPITFTIHMRTTTGLNAREHWSARAKRVRREHLETLAAMPFPLRVKLPAAVHLVRLSPIGRLPDDDNVQGGCKAVRDCIAKRLRVDDGDRGRIRFTYGAERGPWGVRVTIETLSPEATSATE